MGMLFHSAIVRGAVLHTEEVIFGPAMVEAYRLESTVSFHPRVMLGRSTYEDALEFGRKAAKNRKMVARYVLAEPYDVPCLNPFVSWHEDDQA